MNKDANDTSCGLTRGEFLKTAFLSGVLASGAMRPFRAAAGVFSSGKPELTLGILTDIHVSIRKDGEGWRFEGEDVLKRAFEHFRDHGADGVAICGDMADYGLREELNAVARCWYSVFPDDKAPDGRHVEKLFVYGNHDCDGYLFGGNMANRFFGEKGFDHTIKKDIAAAWRETFNEEFTPVWRKEVKGYTFIGAHWDSTHYWRRGEREAHKTVPWFEANGASIDATKPFFFLQHPPLKDTCHGPWVWGHDTGEVTEVLSKYPNAIALSGHSHASLADDRAIWQGTFTSIGCGSLKYTGLEYGDAVPFGRENDNPLASQRGEDAYKIMRKMQTGDGHDGMLARVYLDRIVFTRMDFGSMAPLGDDWVMPLPAAKPMPFDFATRAAKSSAPEFPAGAALAVRMSRGRNRGGKDVRSEDQDVLDIEIPAANRAGRERVFDYAVSITGENGARDERYVFAEGFYRAAESDHAKAPTVCRLAIGRLKSSGELRIEVRPRNSFGVAGGALSARFSLSDVPDAFVEYVESNGSQYVDTGVVGRCSTSADMTLTWLSTNKDGSFLSSRISGSTDTRFILCSNGGSGQYYAGHRTWTTRADAKCDAGRVDHVVCSISHDGTAMTLLQTVNGKTSQSETRNEEAVDTGLNMYLFAQNCGGAPALHASVRCYGVKIWQDGKMVRDFRPCMKNGAACLYDAVARKIFYPLGGSLVAK